MARAPKHAPIHPGEILAEEFMAPLGLSQNALARALDVPPGRIGEIVNGRRGISGDTALRLARYFGSTPAFWMNLQARFDLETASEAAGAAINAHVQPRERAA